MQLTRRQMIVGSAAVAVAGCADPAVPKPTEGRVIVPGGTVAWRRFGDGPKPAVLLIHGGPGFPSDYLEPFAALGDERPVFVWDQLGCGRSDRPTDPALWVLERYVEEMDRVRAAVAPGPVHVFGHSWGSMLAMEWMVTRKPKDVVSLILGGECIHAARFAEGAKALVPTLTPESQAAIAEADRTGDYEAPAYQTALNVDYASHYMARDVTPETSNMLARAIAGYAGDAYAVMWGPAEWRMTGTLASFDRTGDLASLRLPVLFFNGEFDESRPEIAKEHAAMTPGAEAVVIAGAAHLAMLDAPEASNDAIRSFLTRVEAG